MMLNKETMVYAVRVKDRAVLEKSSSGGAFTVISNFFLENGDAVVSTIYNYESHQVEFNLITDKHLRDQAMGSKYVQSNPGNIYREAFKWLMSNPEKNMLFVGMGCQCDGFRKYAETMNIYERVVIVDIICHGSPSPKIWKEYVEILEAKNGGRIEYLTFKDKRKGWNHPTAVAIINGNEMPLNEYVKVYYNNCALRPSCHECPYTTTKRKTDITIGDFLHIEDTIPNFADTAGTSVLLIHTEHGLELFENIKKEFDYKPSNTEECWQTNLEKPTEKSPVRKQFWSEYQTKGIEFIMKKYGKDSFQKKINNKLKNIFGGGYYLASTTTSIVESDTTTSNTSFYTANSFGRAA